jgi:cytidylate kinase
MIKIVTVEREYGCGGSDIARLLSERLGWKLWDQLLTEEIARLADCPKGVVEVREERNDPLYYRLFKSFLRGSYEGSINAPKLKLVDSECIMRITQKVVLQAAGTGNCVIVGRGAQHFLENRQDTLRVFLYAPREDKVRRLMQRGKSESEAQELVDSVDRDRGDFIQRYFHVEWPTRFLYHVMLNTTVGDETVAKAIVDFKKMLEGKSTVASGERNRESSLRSE